MGATIVWFRQNLRLQDTSMLAVAQEREERGEPMVLIYIFDDE